MLPLDATEGAFITTASIAGVKPSGSSLPYAVTKAASIHLTKCLANICAPKIRFNSVSPGLMLTEWGLKFSEQKIEAHRTGTKLKRLPEVDVSGLLMHVLESFVANRSLRMSPIKYEQSLCRGA
jgi:NAD(P)-dependent dehydrogenase (short-subunit alcohol dehydrogenase family)